MRTHTVRRGETLIGIALARRVDVNDLVEWNDLRAMPTPGQVLRLDPPARTAAAPRVDIEIVVGGRRLSLPGGAYHGITDGRHRYSRPLPAGVLGWGYVEVKVSA